MNDVIKTAYALMGGVNQRSVYNWHAPVFLFTNENIAGYLDKMNDVAGKKVLSVAGSGDHAFEALLRGADTVDTFDVNYLQKHVVELKAKMIKHLPHSEFMRFFFEERYFFSRDIIKPIWHTFSPALRVFLNKYYRAKQAKMFRYRAAQSMFYTIDKITYLNDTTAYEHLGHIMPNKISFKHTDLTNVTNVFKAKYDTILLSNISEYSFEEIPDKASKIQMFYDNILCPIADENLNPDGGQICFYYAWSTESAEYKKIIQGLQQRMIYSVDCFYPSDKEIDMISVPTACSDMYRLENCSDIALTVTQRAR